jgi:glycosyltransferase involved in cell wall biosynthesis
VTLEPTVDVAVIHPWMPQYRVPFFLAAKTQLAAAGCALNILYGDAPPGSASRGDAVAPTWAKELPTQRLRLGSRTLLHHSARQEVSSASLVIVEHAIRNIETYPMLMTQRLHKRRVAFWGHGKGFTKADTGIEGRMKDSLLRAGSWYFSYTNAGAKKAVEAGFPAERITVVQNTIDTAALTLDVERARGSGDVRRFKARYGLATSRTALYMGALDKSKRLEFLVAVGDHLIRRFTDFKLLIVGDGPMAPQVHALCSGRPWLIYLGAAFGGEKATYAAAADALLMPGRVGLVAVDSFALGVPIVTTDWPYHAPEFEYLESNRNALITVDTETAFEQGVADLMSAPDRLKALQQGCAASAAQYSMANMVSRFSSGVLQAVGRPTN